MADIEAIRARCVPHGPTDGDLATFAVAAHADRIALLAEVDRIDEERRYMARCVLDGDGRHRAMAKRIIEEPGAAVLWDRLALLEAEVATLRAERLTLAPCALRYCDPYAPLPTKEQVRAAYETADRLRQTEPAERVEEKT